MLVKFKNTELEMPPLTLVELILYMDFRTVHELATWFYCADCEELKDDPDLFICEMCKTQKCFCECLYKDDLYVCWDCEDKYLEFIGAREEKEEERLEWNNYKWGR